MSKTIIENEYTFKEALAYGLNLFVGSGFSTLAKDCEKRFLPTDQNLAQELASQFSVPSSLRLEQIVAVIENTKKEKLQKYLAKRFNIVSFDDRYQVFDKLAIKTIVTTNIDNLFYQVYSNSIKNYLNDIDSTGPSFRDKKAVDIIHLNGSVSAFNKPLRVGSASITSTLATDQDRWRVLKDRLQQYPTLFWGYSMDDTAILQALVTDSLISKTQKDKWILVDPIDSSDGSYDFFSALKFQIISTNTDNMLSYLSEVAKEIFNREIPPVAFTTKELFPHESIPEFGTVPVRPIKDFFLGAAPQWYDIYSGIIHRTEHFNRVRNSINSGKHTIVLGVPGCGKTTLLMQTAIEDFSINYKLISDSMTFEKAKLIKNRLQGARALIFLDNFADSLDAFIYLSETPGIQVVGADREYNFGIVNHRLNLDSFNILNITELSDADVQKCLETIPDSLKQPNYRYPQTIPGMEPSFLEIIELNVRDATLRQRFISVLSKLGKNEPSLRDLLVVISYVNQARVPATLDILLAYMHDTIANYQEVYDMVDKLGSMISDVAGNEFFQLEEQDFYVPRSNILGDAVLSNVSNQVLKEVLLRFHNNVSPYRIYRYDTFRKYAFDHRIMARAFPIAEEGKNFYQELYYRDESPYLLQQEALYLSEKGHYTEAFEMIDLAINTSGGRIWSIRNSHAIILFKANIDHYDDPQAKQTLKRSMTILTECYNWDKRKPFHALTFADQALKYWRVYGDADAIEYLRKAQLWLSNEKKRQPWNRKVDQLLSVVNQAL